MSNVIGIRLEDKNQWERRVALMPEDMAELHRTGVRFAVQRFDRRAVQDAQFEAVGARLTDDVSDCALVLGIKEMPESLFREGGAYMFFSHTIKGQRYNLRMLRALAEKHCTLLDYEVVTDDAGRRLIFFGRHAGLAGMIDTLWTLGQRLQSLGIETPFVELGPAHSYDGLPAAKAAVEKVGARIATQGLPATLAPLVIGFTGYGNVSSGAQEIFDLLPHDEVAPADLPAYVSAGSGITHRLGKVVFKEQDLVKRRDPHAPFNLQEYYQYPERYESAFAPHLSLLSVIVNGIFWTERYPRLATKEQLAALFSADTRPRLIVVGDISCDINGSLACTVRDTESGNPVFVYDPGTGAAPLGFDGPGLAVMAVSNLPTELPYEASKSFSAALRDFVPALAEVDLNGSFEDACKILPPPLCRAVILWRGEFTPSFAYMSKFLS